MGRVFLTQEQKNEYRYSELRKCIGKRVKAHMIENKTSNEALAKGMRMGHDTIRRITEGEDVRIGTTDFLRFLDMAGLKLVDTKKDMIQREASQ